MSDPSYRHGNTLVLAPRPGAAYDEILADELRGTAARTALLAVSFDVPDQVVDMLHRELGDLPARIGVLCANEMTRSAAASSGWEAGPLAVRTVADATNLTDLGIEFTEFVSDWEASGLERLVVGFDSLTSLLQYAEQERTYQFVHVVANRLTAVGAEGVFHLDPSAHDDRTVEVFSGLFDRVVTVTGDGERSVRERPGLVRPDREWAPAPQ